MSTGLSTGLPSARETSKPATQLHGSGRFTSSPGSLATSLWSPRSPADKQSKNQHEGKAEGIAFCTGLFVVLTIIALAHVFSARGAWFDENQSAPSNWCPELVFREFQPEEFEVSINHSRIVRFVRDPDYAVANFVRVELKWYLRTKDLRSEPFVAFVVRARNSSLGFLIDVNTKEFKVIPVDLNPIYFSDQLKERHLKQRPTATLDLEYATPFRAAIYVREDYQDRRMTMELYDTVHMLYKNETLISKLYKFWPRNPRAGMDPVMYVITGTMKNETKPSKPKLSYTHAGCSIDRKSIKNGRTHFDPLCRSRNPGRFYVCKEGDKKAHEDW